jgi:hypothetical protein
MMEVWGVDGFSVREQLGHGLETLDALLPFLLLFIIGEEHAMDSFNLSVDELRDRRALQEKTETRF